jgi:hypothetical protein
MALARLAVRSVLFTALLALNAGGCTITVSPDGGGDGDGDGEPVESIHVVVVNETDTALDPELYVSAEAASVDELFEDSNKYTSLGVGSVGVLNPGGSDEIELVCSEARVIGTAGGVFGDDLSEPDGRGRRLVLTRDLNIFCGDTLTLRYQRTEDGFTTVYDVEQ